MASTIQVRVDDEIKSKADMLFKDRSWNGHYNCD